MKAASENRAARQRRKSVISEGAATSKGQRKYSPTLKRSARRSRDPRAAVIIAYDFETTRIEAGTPRPLYITAYGEKPAPMYLESPIRDMAHLRLILVNEFLTEENKGVKFVAWNGNNFDVYFVAAALVSDDRFLLRPYLTKSDSLRGIRVSLISEPTMTWEFLDGIAMLGLTGVNLERFLLNFAPEHKKLTGLIDFDTEEFNPADPVHRAYAMRDSLGLYKGMQRAQQILLDTFDQPLTVTMGGACIKIFKAHIPDETLIHSPLPEVMDLIRQYVMRGGYCYCVRRYVGPVWKYDINQAYAAAMRDADLPAGFTTHLLHSRLPSHGVYIARITAAHRNNPVPFYYRGETDGRLRSYFARDYITDTWLTSIEIAQLKSEGWKIDVHESYSWSAKFSMREYVQKLEHLRTTCDGGPSGPIGTMIKMVGNHSYGKTVEQLEPLEFLLAAECPEGFAPYYGDTDNPIEHVFFRFVEDQKPKDYHQPQIGAFITAHVRMVLRRAALIDPAAWVYADTDCVVFTRDVTDRLDIDAKRYGAWKIEENGARYQIIAKKVYSEIGGDKPKRSAKGMNVKKLTAHDFDDWINGRPPEQVQTQRQKFFAVMRGAEMYRLQKRRGTAVDTDGAPLL